MSDWTSLLARPSQATQSTFDAWFTKIAERLLIHAHLIVAGQPHRITEVEAYYHSEAHADPFAHRHPVQRTPGRWYFHRVGNSYRGGTFKGLDLSFGDPNSYGGFLIRGLETASGALIDGPSLCVEHLLKWTEQPTVARLDQVIGERLAWDKASPVHLETAKLAAVSIYRSARIGLTMKKASNGTLHHDFINLPFRFLTEPRRIRKGKRLLALALHEQQKSAEEIRDLIGSPLASIQRWMSDAIPKT